MHQNLSVSVVLCDMEMQSTSSPVNFGGQCRLVSYRSFVCHLSTLAKAVSSETTGPISIKLHMQPSGKWKKKIYTLCLGHMTKMPVIPIYCKNLKKSSLELLCKLP